MKGRFTAVVHGELETGPRLPVAPLAAAVLAAALLSWLATVILLLAVILAAMAVILAVPCFLLLRRNDRDTELLAERAAELNAEVAAQRSPRAVENHYHLHLSAGADASGINWASLPIRHATATEEE